jgi:hypothetical protein
MTILCLAEKFSNLRPLQLLQKLDRIIYILEILVLRANKGKILDSSSEIITEPLGQ